METSTAHAHLYGPQRKRWALNIIQVRAAFHRLLTDFCYREHFQNGRSPKEPFLAFFIILSNILVLVFIMITVTLVTTISLSSASFQCGTLVSYLFLTSYVRETPGFWIPSLIETLYNKVYLKGKCECPQHFSNRLLMYYFA